MKLSRTEVCKRVSMSLATFDRWRKAGKLETFTDGTLSNAKKQIVWVTLEALGKALGIADEITLRLRLGLPEITPEPIKRDLVINKHYEDAKPTPDIREPDAFAPKEVEPEPYRDSFGHTITGNREHRMFETQPYTPIDSTAHMNPALVNSGPKIENPVDSDAFVDLWRKSGEPTSAERRKLQGKEITSQHPNANRQAYLRAIRPTGYSR
jgi:hypothetical protein